MTIIWVITIAGIVVAIVISVLMRNYRDIFLVFLKTNWHIILALFFSTVAVAYTTYTNYFSLTTESLAWRAVVSDTRVLKTGLDSLSENVIVLRKQIASLDSNINRVTTAELMRRLLSLERRTQGLHQEYADLHHYISRDNAEAIITIASVKDQNEQNRERLNTLTMRVEGIETYFIAALISAISGMAIVYVFLENRFKKLSKENIADRPARTAV